MASYNPNSGYVPSSGAFVSPKKKFPSKRGMDRQLALLEQERNPRVNTQGFGGLADMRAQNAIDPVTNLPVSMGEFDKDQVMANLTRAGEFEAAGLLRNYQQKLPGSAEALMEFLNMRQAQQQFAQRPQATQAAIPPNPYPATGQKTQQMYVPTGQPQPPANVTQIAGDAAAATGRTAAGPAAVQVPSSVGTMLAGAIPKPAAPVTPRVSGGVNIDPSLWTPNNIARLNPTSRSPLPENPNDMIGRPRSLGLVYSSGGSSNIAPAGGKVAGWSPTYSGDRQMPVAPQGAQLPMNPYQAAPAPFDMQAAVARNRAALDAKYPTPEIPAAGLGNVAIQPQVAPNPVVADGQSPEARQELMRSILHAPSNPRRLLDPNRESVLNRGKLLAAAAEQGALSRRSPLQKITGNASEMLGGGIASLERAPGAIASAITAPIRSGYGALGALGGIAMDKGRQAVGAITGLTKPETRLTKAEKEYQRYLNLNPHMANR